MADRNIRRPPTRHECQDCRHKFSIGRAATWRAARPKCPMCGSGRLEPIEKKKE